MNLPLIDVVIPCYNAEQTLVRAVESVLLQGNLGRLWLIDDASTDNTFALAYSLPRNILAEFLSSKCRKTVVSRWLEIGGRCSLLKVRSILLRF